MAVTHELEYGWSIPVLACGVSVLGSLLGLVCTDRARREPTIVGRVGWLTGAAIAIGETGIWLMHFVAMLGFAVDGTEIRYSVGPTALSVVIAVLVVGAGLAVVVGPERPGLPRVAAGGLVIGLGMAAMHYTGTAAMRMDGTISYAPAPVVASVVLAVAGASAALRLAVRARGLPSITRAALVLGVTITGMHYVGMQAVRVRLSGGGRPWGMDLISAIPLTAALAGTLVALLLYATLSIPTDEELIARAEADAAGAE